MASKPAASTSKGRRLNQVAGSHDWMATVSPAHAMNVIGATKRRTDPRSRIVARSARYSSTDNSCGCGAMVMPLKLRISSVYTDTSSVGARRAGRPIPFFAPPGSRWHEDCSLVPIAKQEVGMLRYELVQRGFHNAIR